jgi:hypothetical protein
LKKIFFFLVSFCCTAQAMTLLCESVGQYELPDVVVKNARETFAHFGGFDYLDATVTMMGREVIDSRMVLKTVMNSSQYKTCCSRDESEGPYRIRLYKKNDDGRYCLIGQSIFWLLDTKKYLLEFLHVAASERGKKLGTILFVYTIHIIRQLGFTADGLPCVVSLRACPFGETGARAQKRLNRFYKRLGCVFVNKRDNLFEWRGSSLAPFNMA